MIKPEILAPAGSMEALYAAIHAGVDAVYFGGKALSARAYASNFGPEQIKEACRLLHAHRAKAYVTINTLVKTEEIKILEEMGDSLSQAGVDGLILQDMGAYLFFKTYFPNLALHASTQMTVHSIAGAKRLYDLGFERVVLSRELNLKEVKEIMAAVPIEVETFVHGAMCYSYSGQCQMSAAYGERSANRGRCAQPCRLPYDSQAKQGYLLSLKDQMTLYHLPNLVEAGIHSFKIEGRMKNPEYVYTTASIYRKYRDLALSQGPYQVDQADISKMNEVFSRGQTSEGYYFVRKSANMIFPQQPKTSQLTNQKTLAQLSFVRQKPDPKSEVDLDFKGQLGQPIELSLQFKGDLAGLSGINMTGLVVEAAQKKAVSKTDIEKPLSQTGDTRFEIGKLEVSLADNVFIPLSQVKDLRRQVLNRAEEKYQAWLAGRQGPKDQKQNRQEVSYDYQQTYRRTKDTCPQVSVLVRTGDQLDLALGSEADRIYIEWSFMDKQTILDILRPSLKAREKQVFLAMPHILRNSDQKRFWQDFDQVYQALLENQIELGVLARTSDYLDEVKGRQLGLVLDHSMNIWNPLAYQFYEDRYRPLDICLSNEITYQARSRLGSFEMVVYGKLATMQTANCLANLDAASKDKSSNPMCSVGALETLDYITDRKGIRLGYHRNCKTCSNTIFNSIPLFLADQETDYAHCLRFELLDERAEEVAMILDMIWAIKNKEIVGHNPFSNFTRGHFHKGVE